MSLTIEKLSYSILKCLYEIGAIDSAISVDTYQLLNLLNEREEIPDDLPWQIVESGLMLLKGLDLAKVGRSMGVFRGISLTGKGVRALETITGDSINMSDFLT